MNVWRLGDAVVDLDTQRVQRGDVTARLSPRATAVLRALIACGNRPLSREAALDQVWTNAATGDEVLSKAVNELRQALGDTDPRARRCIETIPKSGYRLICRIEALAAPDDAAPAAPPPDDATTHDSHADAPMAPPARRPRRLLILVAAALATLTALALLYRDDHAAPTHYPAATLRAALQESRQLAPGEAYLGYAEISPDGRRAFYASPRDGSIRLVAQSIDGDAARPVSAQVAEAQLAPAVAHDGSAIVYQSFADGGCRIRLHRFADASERDLGACSLRFAEWMEFTPDDRALLVARMQPGDTAMSLHRIDLASAQVTPYDYPRDPGRSDVQARHSPDGRWLALRRGPQPHSSLWLVDRAAGTLREVVDDSFGLDGFAWLPDSSGLVVGAAFGTGSGLWRVDAHDGQREHLGLRGANCPVIARGDGTMLYTRGARRFGVFRVHPDGRADADAPQPWAADTGNDWLPRHSVDGRQIAFLSDRDGPVAVYVAVNGAPPRRLPDIAGAVPQSMPAFDAGGRRVLVTARRADATTAIYETSLDAPAWSPLGQRSNVEEVAASGDGHWIYYVARDGEHYALWRRSRETGAEQHVAANLARGPIALDSRGGVYFVDRQRQALVRLDPADGHSEVQLDDMGYWNAYAWTLAGDRVYALLEPAGANFGLYAATPGLSPQLVEPLDGVPALGIAMTSPDGPLFVARPPRAGQALLQSRLPPAQP